MPSLSTIRKRRQRSEEDDETDESTSASSPNPTPQSNSKRPRIEVTQGEQSESGSDVVSEPDNENEGEREDSMDSSQADTQAPATQTSIVPNGVRNQAVQEGYKPGAIVRIKVTDFVTYTSAEFFPGPKLNMVIGPNGTGKSTLVCAICLGLGWGPQHLGRAKDTGEFVKHGCREATIEIELAGGPKFSRNPVVTRTIKRDGNKSTFTLNGKPANRNQVLRLAQSFAIQVDNLCQFLPQDKVSEFAALTPIELLSSTQRAAAGAEMVEWHENLKTLRSEQKRLQADNQGDKDLLQNLEERQEMQRADVERMRQRALIKKRIELLEECRPIVLYKTMHRQFDQLKLDKDSCHRELEMLKAELEPVMRSVNEKQEYCMQLEAAIKHKQRGVDAANKAATDIGRKVEEHEQNMKDLESEIEAEKKSSTALRNEALKIKQTINRLTRQLNEEPVEFDPDWYNEQIREKRRQVRDIEDQASEIRGRRRPLLEEVKEKSDRLKEVEQQLQGLDSQSGRQEKKLYDASKDSYKAYKWLQDNQDKFEKEVFGPPIVTCSIKDPRYADHVESLLQRTDFIAFTVQSRNDFRTLQRHLNGEQKLHDIAIRTSVAAPSNLRSPLPDNQLQDLGFQGWAKDFLQGPEPVLAVLCGENRLHQTPISLRDISDETYRSMENGPISSWVSGKQAYQITRRREYGPSATSTRVRSVRQAKVWTSQPVDVSAKGALERTIQALRVEKEAAEEKIESEKAKLTQLGEHHSACERERQALEKEKNDKQNAHTNFRAIPELIRQQEAKKRTNDAQFAEMRERVIRIRNKQDQLSLKKAEAAIQYADAVENLRALQEEVIKLSLWKIEGMSDVEILKAHTTDHRERLTAKEGELAQKLEEVKEMAQTLRKLSKEAGKTARRVREDPELEAIQQEVFSHTVEQLEADIDSEKARLELTHGGSSNVIQEFEERERQIERLRGKLTDFEKKLEDYNHAIHEIRGKWEPKLDAIIQSVSDAFSDSFARIGCAGQVSLDKAGEEPGPDGEPSGNDFDQWSIQVHVKFREHESLSLLDSHRQSGGERAVSTIFYLMALQSLSASPFRVVDEINQGMDPRNERMVHERLVDIACAPSGGDSGGGQYFLITPKLLSGLVYKPGMRVLCIVSGEHMPKDHNEIDFGAAVRNMRAVTERTKRMGRAIDSSTPMSSIAA
ncbi:P-loop containing nucleoside triphosphate hydrolase protein [Aspergillus pseudodeflectus]|uniref:Structural maintenance of chromosomes protein 5 n=1 Tax=Aspergillus pseudodeflectus TaxID=176178 RepID=A0ABR4K1L5_9EURO